MATLTELKKINRAVLGETRNKRSKTSKQGLSWFYSLIKKSAKDFAEDAFNPKKEPFIGGLFFFRYTAKYAGALPYWDAFPLVIPFGVDSQSFIGLNLHYLPDLQRRKLLEYLMTLKAKKTTRQYMRISYEALKTSSKSPLYEPCIKRYLISHVRSRFVKVSPDEWMNAALLPVAQWKKSTPY
jgi:hypothetical protein